MWNNYLSVPSYLSL